MKLQNAGPTLVSRNSRIKDLISLEAPEERAVLVGAPLKRTPGRHAVHDHLAELARLADTAGARVVASVTQQIERPDPATYVGSGKVEELRTVVADRNATLVVFDDELSPAQGKNLEEVLGKRVIDRAELILDIFATRARTAEAKMQVELAQLEYSLPRLTRMWTHLEKFRGGIGVRGPGETQLETDRRLVGQRIKILRERLEDVARARTVQRQSRRGAFRAALVGYTNAGKSSILRALARDEDVFVEDRLFATLDPLTREVAVDDKHEALVTDTVGFIRKLPHHLVASFRATLEEVKDADVLVHVIDASHPQWEEQRTIVEDVLHDMGVTGRPTVHAFNKMDLIAPVDAEDFRKRIEASDASAVCVSAMAPEGIEPLRRALRDAVLASRPEVELRVPSTDGRLLAQVYRETEVLDRRADDGVLVLRVRAERSAIGRLEASGATRSSVGGTSDGPVREWARRDSNP